MNVVVVESPAKAKTLNKYLGKDFRVLASFGHIRDLPPKDGSVDTDNDFSMKWEVSRGSGKHIAEIAKALKGAETLYLASDPDREGEAIAWHVLEALNEKKVLKNVTIKRVVFHEITKKAILEAFNHPRELNQELVQAYLARRALDYLVGFTLSPVLWRKLPGSRSAGRVQSVALRLIIEREDEIERFKSREYWTVEGNFLTKEKQPFTAMLTHYQGNKLDKFDLNDTDKAHAAVKDAKAQTYHVEKIERKQVKRNPAAPFITSTLQQEASRKLGFGASRTMMHAQRLYEGVEIKGETVGLITYMRTDSVSMSMEAINASRSYIEKEFGANYVPSSPRMYKTKSKNAQEAHEAIRPTDMTRHPDQVKHILDADQLKLYTLVWRRAVASQMESAVLDQVGADIASPDKQIIFRATGSTIRFDGFLKLYEEGKDNEPDEDKKKLLPPMEEQDPSEAKDITTEQHFTQPPPRYSEASLVKKMEELGIGRPSTYASIIKVLQDRQYVKLDKKRFIPEERGWLVISFLSNFFKDYVQYDFTADLEDQLDDVATGQKNWKKLLEEFWSNLDQAVGGTKELTLTKVLDVLDEELSHHFFPSTEKDDRKCPKCDKGKLHLKLGKYGAFIGCESYPECTYIKKIGADDEPDDIQELSEYPKELGVDPEAKEIITMRKGPYGFYVQLGEGSKGKKPKRAGVPKGTEPESIDLEKAISMLAFPKELGQHPETGKEISVGVGRYGPYVKYGKAFISVKDEDILTMPLERAIEIIDSSPKKAKG